jgi:hypothetical protein
MADPERRRRMSRSISLVLLGSLPGLAWCAGCGRNRTEEVEEVTEEPPPSGPEHLAGGPFIAWWRATHPPIVVRKTLPRSTATSGGYTSGRRRVSYVPIGGRSGYLSSRPSSGLGPGHSPNISRGGFGSSGHGAVGG